MQASSYDKIIWDHTWTFTVPDRSSAECIAYASIAIFCKQSNTHVQLYSCTCTASDCMSCSFNCKHSFSLFTLGSGTWGALNENLRELLHTNIPLISGNYGLRSSDAQNAERLEPYRRVHVYKSDQTFYNTLWFCILKSLQNVLKSPQITPEVPKSMHHVTSCD